MHIPCTWSDGHRRWKKHKRFHRIGGPASETHFASSYYQKGKLHRINGPAINCVNGWKVYLQFGKRHRTNGPAFQMYGRIEYWQRGEKIR